MPFPKFKTQEEVPEAFRSEYEEKDGEWVPKANEPGPTRKQIEAREAAAIKRAKEAEARAQELEQELSAKTAGVSPEELQKVRANVEKEWKGKLDEALAQVHELTFGSQLATALADAEIVDVADGRAVFGARFEMVDGKLVPKDDKSVPVKQFIDSTLRKEKPHLFKGTKAEGGDARGAKGAAPKGKITYEEWQKLGPADRQKYADQVEKQAA